MNSNLPIMQEDAQKRMEAERQLNEQQRQERIKLHAQASINISMASQDDIEKSIAWLEMQKSSLPSIVDEIDKKIEELRVKLGKPKADSKPIKESRPKNEPKQKSEHKPSKEKYLSFS